MTGLQEAFYIIAIVYMGVSFLIILVAVAAVLVIRHKVVSLERMVKERIDTAMMVGEKAGEVIDSVRKFAKRKSK